MIRTLLLLFVASLISLSTACFAHEGPYPNHGGTYCRGYDPNGESYYSCDSCERNYDLGYQCKERCYNVQFRCTAVGSDFSGREESFNAYSRDQQKARGDAQRECENSLLYNCKIQGCTENTQFVYEGDC